ncbi:MAG: hypothetical protein Q4A57_01710 [Porphyromonas circumdentaria]|nr:hypothetical protein [Porphyromonas circumdentaria]
MPLKARLLVPIEQILPLCSHLTKLLRLQTSVKLAKSSLLTASFEEAIISLFSRRNHIVTSLQ